MKTIEIEVCERLLDNHLVPVCDQTGNITHWKKAPKYHAQIKGKPGLWACGKSADEAVGNLIATHSEKFGIRIQTLGKLPR